VIVVEEGAESVLDPMGRDEQPVGRPGGCCGLSPLNQGRLPPPEALAAGSSCLSPLLEWSARRQGWAAAAAGGDDEAAARR
jgi:hypothetical protein